MSNIEQEQQLLKGLALNDKKAIESIYRDNYSMVQALVLNNTGTADDARDIFQEAMIVLFEKATSGSFELNCQLKTYIYSVCRRLWLKKLHQMHRFITPVEFLEETVAVEEEAEAHEKLNADFAMMENAMSTLTQCCAAPQSPQQFRRRMLRSPAICRRPRAAN